MATLNPNTDIVITNKRSINTFKAQQGSDCLEIVANPKKNGSLFFVCGGTTGIVSRAVQADLNNLTEAQLCVGDMSILGKPAVPVLMMVGDGKKNVVRTF